MSFAEFGDEIFDTIENSIFGFNSSDDDSAPDPFADDEFFHPKVIHDDETCKWILHYHISHVGVKLWDLLLFLPSSVFLSCLLLGLPKARQRLQALANSGPVTTLYTLVFMVVCTGVLRCLVNIVVQVERPDSSSEKILWSGTQMVYLAAELSILGIGATFHFIGKAGLRRVIVSACLLSAILCGVQVYLEIYKPYYGNKVLRSGTDLYGHGGPQYWTFLSGLASLLYLSVLLLPTLPTKTLVIPRTSVLYVYVGLQLVLNVATCTGAILLSLNHHSGMCITDVTSYLYYSFLPAAAYLCFVRPSLKLSRPNLLFSYTTQVWASTIASYFLKLEHHRF